MELGQQTTVVVYKARNCRRCSSFFPSFFCSFVLSSFFLLSFCLQGVYIAGYRMFRGLGDLFQNVKFSSVNFEKKRNLKL